MARSPLLLTNLTLYSAKQNETTIAYFTHGNNAYVAVFV